MGLSSLPTSLCLLCGRQADEFLAELRDVPVQPNVIFASAAKARSAPRADIELAFCDRCGLIWNTRFDPQAELAYGEEYENSLHFSREFQRHSEALADRLIDRYGLAGGHVAEIGSGKGEFLALLCERGSCTGVGFDPSYAGESDHRADGRLTFVRDLVTESSDLGEPDLVACRQVIEHLDDPVGALAAVRRALGGRSTILYAEVPSAEYMLREGALWDVIYPHVTYLSAATLADVLERAGFHVLDHGYSFRDEYVWVEASTIPAGGRHETDGDAEISKLVSGFSGRVDAKKRSWEQILLGFVDRGPLALWGAGAKGVTFLNVVPSAGEIGAVVDVNPRKHGKYLAGTGHVIEPPDALVEARPGTVVVMNPAYRDEISQTLDDLGVEAAVMVA